MNRPDPKSKIKDMQSSALMRWPRLSYGALPLVILLLVLIACVIGYGLANANLEVSRGKSVERALKENEIRNVATLDSYVNLTRGNFTKESDTAHPTAVSYSCGPVISK